MTPLGETYKHLRLLAGMAKATETDLVGAFGHRRLGPEEWAEMVQSCRQCQWAGRCARWLRDHPVAPRAPGPCRNRGRLDALKAVDSAH